MAKNYDSTPKYAQVLNEENIIMIGKFFKTFIFWDFGNIQFSKSQCENDYYIPQNKMNFHCYGFNNNTDVLFTKQDHNFSFSTMKYDFEEGFIPDIPNISTSTPPPLPY